MATTRNVRAAHLPVRSVLGAALVLVALAAGCGSASEARSVAAGSGDESTGSVIDQTVCGYEPPIESPQALASTSDHVLVVRLVGVEPDVTRSEQDEDDPDPAQFVSAGYVYEVERSVSGREVAPGTKVTIPVRTRLERKGKVISTISTCGWATIVPDQQGQEFLLFTDDTKTSFQQIVSSYGIAQVRDGEVAAVGGGAELGEDVRSAHPLASLVGVRVDDLAATLKR